MLNMWKLDSTIPKHVIKTNQNKQNSKNLKFAFLDTSMRAHTWSMRMHASSIHTHASSMRMHTSSMCTYTWSMCSKPQVCVHIHKACAHIHTPRNTVFKQVTNNNQTKPSMLLINLSNSSFKIWWDTTN